MHPSIRLPLRAFGVALLALAAALLFAACAPADGNGNGGTPALELALSGGGNVTVDEGDIEEALTVTLTPSGGLAGNATLSFASADLTGSFDPATVDLSGTATSTLTLGIPTAPGTYTGTVTATAGSITKTADVTVTVNQLAQPAIAVIAPDTVTVGEGGTATVDVEVQALGGFTGDVTLAVTGGAELNPTLSTSTVTFTGSGSTTVELTVTVPAGSAGTDYPVTITATGAGVADASDTVTIASVAAETVYVDPAGDDANSGLTASEPVATIGQALSLVQEGGTVILAEGSYSGPVSADKDVTIKGADGADKANVVVDGGITTALGTDVTLQNLSARNSTGGAGTAAVVVNGDATLDNVNVSDAFYGIWVADNLDSAATTVTMTTIDVSDVEDDAIRAQDPNATVSITGATVSYPAGYSGFGDGIDISTAASATVDTATVTGADAGVQLFSEPQSNITTDFNVPDGATATLLGVTVTNPVRFGVVVGEDIDAGESANFVLGSDTQLVQINFDTTTPGDFFLVDARPANSGELDATNVRFGGARLTQNDEVVANPSGEKFVSDPPSWQIKNSTGTDSNNVPSDNHINFGL